jgi:hypothetical protein
VQDGKVIRNDRLSISPCDVTVVQMIRGGGYFCSTNSLCFRQELYKNPPKYKKMADTGDFPLQIYMALSGKVRYFPEIMGCYRVMSSGSWSSTAKAEKTPLNHYLNMLAWMKELDRDTNGRYRSAIYYFLVSLLYKPTEMEKYSRKDYLGLFKQINIFSRDLPLKSKYRAVKYYLHFKTKRL